MVGLLVLGFIANLLVRPVASKHHVENEPEDAEDRSTSGDAEKVSGRTSVEPAGKPAVPVPVAWIVVGIPILYGLTYTFINGIQLFLN